MRADAGSNRGASAYHPNVLPLGQTSSLSFAQYYIITRVHSVNWSVHKFKTGSKRPCPPVLISLHLGSLGVKDTNAVCTNVSATFVLCVRMSLPLSCRVYWRLCHIHVKMLYVELLISRARVTHNVYNAVANLCARNLSQIHNNRKKEKIKAFLCSMENPSSKSLTLYRSHEHPPTPTLVCVLVSVYQSRLAQPRAP